MLCQMAVSRRGKLCKFDRVFDVVHGDSIARAQLAAAAGFGAAIDLDVASLNQVFGMAAGLHQSRTLQKVIQADPRFVGCRLCRLPPVGSGRIGSGRIGSGRGWGVRVWAVRVWVVRVWAVRV